MTYAQDLTFGLRLAFGLGLEFLVASTLDSRSRNGKLRGFHSSR